MTTNHTESADDASPWRVDDERNGAARDRALEALTSGHAARDLADYYRWESNYAGATFAGLQPNDPDQVAPVDLLAVTTLSVTIPPMAIRRFTDSETNTKLSLLLKQLDLNLRLESPAVPDAAESMARFYELVKTCLRRANARSSDAWVTASKICARKRPHLFPVRDSVVIKLLGLSGKYPDDWPVFAALVADAEVTGHLDMAVRSAAGEGVQLGDPSLRLRHLDAVLWTNGTGSR